MFKLENDFCDITEGFKDNFLCECYSFLPGYDVRVNCNFLPGYGVRVNCTLLG